MTNRPFIDPPSEPMAASTYWDSMYQNHATPSTPSPNAFLVEEVADLGAGTALDLGCGTGGDSIWLSQGGWAVTAVDVSAVAVDRARQHARDAGADGGIQFEVLDLARDFPVGSFDLVSAQFLQSPIDLPWSQVCRRTGEACAPGGRVVIGMHAGWPTWFEDPPGYVFATVQEIVHAVIDGGAGWEVVRAETVTSPSTSPAGVDGERANLIVHLRRS